MSVLKRLSNHSIFRGTDSESIQSNHHPDSKKIVSRGDEELFIASGNTIRCCDISSNVNDYKILKCGEINFDINKLIINDSGTLLAAYNDNKIVVCSLPSPGFMENFNQDSIPVRSYHVATLIFNDSTNKILDLYWSSIARYDSELVILTSDSYIRTFDLTVSSKTPQFELNLTNNSTGLGLANIVSDPVSISVGSTNQDNPSQCLTLYILSGDGDIYALYPFVPNCLAVSESFVKKLFDQTALYLQNAETEFKRVELLQQLKFISALYKDLDKSQKEIKVDIEGNVEEFHHLTPPNVKETLKVQGPFSIAPFPNILYSYDACEIDHVACGDTDIIITIWSNGSCLLLFQDQELIMRWNHNFAPDDDESLEFDKELTLSSLEYIPLTQNDSSSIRIAGLSQLTPFQYFVVLGNSKLIKIDFKLWGEKLHSSISSGSPDDLIEALSQTLTSKLILLSQEPDFEGFTVLSSADNTYIIKLGGQNVDVIEVKEPIEETIDDENLEIKLRSSQLDSNPVITNEQILYESLLSGPFSEITDLLKDAKSSKLFSQELETDITLELSFDDETSLKDLLKVSNFVVKQRISTLHKLGVNLHYRIKMQHRELKSQITQLVDEFGQDKTELRRAKIVNLENRIQDLSDKQQSSLERLDILLVKLNKLLQDQESKSKNLLISKEEQAWFNQLDKLEKQLSKLKSKFSDYQEQLKFINSIIHTNGLNSIGLLGENNKKYSKLKQKLVAEKKLVDLVGTVLGEDISEVDKLMSDMKV